MNNIEKNNVQFDYFSSNYQKFEEDFYRYSAMDIPLTFLTDDIMREMAISQKNYFLLNKENARDGRNHYFHFEVSLPDSKTLVRQYRYLGNDWNKAISAAEIVAIPLV